MALSKGEEKFLDYIKCNATERIHKQYVRGAEQHEHDLFRKNSLVLVEDIMEEILDAYVYLQTLREKLLQVEATLGFDLE